MMKSLSMTCFVMILSGCASTEFDRRIENNFIYQCSLKLISDVEKRINGEDAAKICTAAYQVEKPETNTAASAEVTPAPSATPTPSASPVAEVSPTPVPSPTPAATPKSLVDLDEVKPEPTPAE